MTNDTNNTSSIISKVWSFMTILRDDGVGYGDYLDGRIMGEGEKNKPVKAASSQGKQSKLKHHRTDYEY